MPKLVAAFGVKDAILSAFYGEIGENNRLLSYKDFFS